MNIADNVEDKKANKRKRKWLILLLLLITIGIVGGIYWNINQSSADFFLDKSARDGLIAARSKEDVQKVLDTVVEKGMFNVSINPNPIFKDGTSEGDLWIENIKANHYYTSVTITLDDSKETVFKSGGIKPDQNIEQAKLSKNLKKGNYPATAAFKIIDPATLKEIGLVNVNITITIQN